MSAKSKLFRHGFLTMGLKGTGMLFSYGFTLLVTNIYGASGYGQYSLFFAMVSILSIVALLGTDRSVIRLFNVRDSTVGNSNVMHAFFVVTSTSVLVALGAYLAWPAIVGLLFTEVTEMMKLRPYIGILVFYSLYIYISEALRGTNRMVLYGFLRFNAVFLFSLLILVFLSKQDLASPIKSFVFGVCVVFLLSLLFFFSSFRMIPRLDRTVVNNVLRISYPMLLSSSMGLIVGWVDTFMLGYFDDEASVGIYNVAFKIGFFSSILLTTINTVISPQIARFSAEGRTEELRTLMHKVSKILFYGALAIFLVSIFNMKLLLSFFGPEFTEGSMALAVLLIGQFISSYSGPVAILLQMSGHEKSFMYISVIAMLLNVGLNLLLIPQYGYLGAAIASAASLIINNVCCVYMVKVKMGFYSLYIPWRNA